MKVKQVQEAVDAYLKFMWNKWDRDRCIIMFDATCYSPDHIWQIWTSCVNENGWVGAPATFWSKVDKDVQRIILDDVMDYAQLRES